MDLHRSQTDKSPQTLVGISFENAFRAQEFLLAVGGLAAAGDLKLADAVTVLKDQSGKTVVQETVDPPLGRSAFSGALWAGLFGLMLGGPVGWVAGIAVGAAGGAVTATVIDLGISDEWVDWFKDVVRPDSATVALLVEDLDRDALVAEAARFSGARFVYANLDDATIERLRTALGSPDVPVDASVSHPA